MNLVGSRSYATPAKAIGNHNIVSQRAFVSGGAFAFLKETLNVQGTKSKLPIYRRVSQLQISSDRMPGSYSVDTSAKRQARKAMERHFIFYVQKVYVPCLPRAWTGN